MTSQYQLNEELRQYPFFKYRYDEKQVTFYSLMGIEPEENSHLLNTAHEVITNWSKVCEELFTDEMSESDLLCWQGHYEQFGLVMFNLAKMCRNRKTHGACK